MTTTLPPHTPGLRRIIPPDASPAVVEHLRALVEQTDGWVRRPSWADYLARGGSRHLRPIEELSRDQLVAVHAWFRQQRHALYRVLEDATGPAPDGWVESLPLYRVVRDGARLDV
ncbi:MAG: hypothetical protein KY461_05595 [Actinobacteria bacterium]|nr:hypothetical protein [Actinomycetota bacterium]